MEEKKQSVFFPLSTASQIAMMVLLTVTSFFAGGLWLKANPGTALFGGGGGSSATITKDAAGLPALAASLKINKGKFVKCLDSGEMAQKVKDSAAGAAKVPVSGTPTTVVLDTKTGSTQLIGGAMPYESVKAVIDRMLAGSATGSSTDSIMAVVNQVLGPESANSQPSEMMVLMQSFMGGTTTLPDLKTELAKILSAEDAAGVSKMAEDYYFGKTSFDDFSKGIASVDKLISLKNGLSAAGLEDSQINSIGVAANDYVVGKISLDELKAKVASASKISVDPVVPTDHYKGPKNARLVMITYTDFECPYCKKFHPTSQQVLDNYKNDVALVYRHFPLSFHANAQKFAEGSECAFKIGGEEAFWKMADKLFAL